MDNSAILTDKKVGYRIICKLRKCNLKSAVETIFFHLFFPRTAPSDTIMGLGLFLLRNLSLKFGKQILSKKAFSFFFFFNWCWDHQRQTPVARLNHQMLYKPTVQGFTSIYCVIWKLYNF